MARKTNPARSAGLSSPRRLRNLSRRIALWFAADHRDLPWRRNCDPYRVWISEIMLQQTRVEAVIPYFRRFVKRFPSVGSLARADEEEVLGLWAGLGYYARARNLHHAAIVICREHGGKIPSDPEMLLSLPGVGKYTAGAIVSIAHNQPSAVVDGNVRRVLSRLFALREDLFSAAGRERIWELADRMVRYAPPRHFNQGLMELGALICIPASPRCDVCPVSRSCGARRNGNPTAYPVGRSRPVIRESSEVFAVVARRGRYLLGRRRHGLRYGGLWEFPRAEIGRFEMKEVPSAFRDQHGIRLRCTAFLAGAEYPIMNLKMKASFVQVELMEAPQGGRVYSSFRWVPASEFQHLAMPAPVRREAVKLAGLSREANQSR